MFQVTLQEIDAVCTKFNAPTLSQYLHDTGNLYAIASFDKKINVSPMDGESDPKLINFIARDTGLQEGTTAGYAQHADILKKPVEIFVFQEKLLKSKDVLLGEILILHEFCHLLDQRRYFEKVGLTLDSKEQAVGEALYKQANDVNQRMGGWGEDVGHNANFGGILAHYLIQFDPEKWHRLLDKAMYYNFLMRRSGVYLQSYRSVK